MILDAIVIVVGNVADVIHHVMENVRVVRVALVVVVAVLTLVKNSVIIIV